MAIKGVIPAWIIFSVITTNAFAVMNPTGSTQPLQRFPIPGEIMVALKVASDKKATQSLNQTLKTVLDAASSSEILVTKSESGTITISKFITQDKNDSADKLIAKISKIPGVEWAAPNYLYVGDYREFAPNDPKANEQHHHMDMKSFEAWDITLGQEDIVVAVTDGSFDLAHEDMAGRYYANPDEIPDNGVDDDRNGYVDDIIGWNFASNNNNPDLTFDNDMWSAEHGTHVAGIVAANANNNIGIAGAAPGVRVMPLRWVGENSWTSEVVAKTYRYAVDNGARIITTSYNVDGFVDDKVYLAAVDYIFDKGVLLFNSAGNSGVEDSPRSAITKMVIVCATNGGGGTESDGLAEYSNYGKGIDVCAPGGHNTSSEMQILSAAPKSEYQRMAGTSMASPNAAAVAALIWSVHPEWNRDQVAAKLIAAADDITQINGERMRGKLGSGRVNSYHSVKEELPPPRIQKLLEVANGGTIGKMKEITVRFANVFDASSINSPSSWQLNRVNGGKSIPLTPKTKYVYGTNQLVFTFPTATLAPGTYEFVGSADMLKDPFGQKLDGNGDGTGDENFVVRFTVTGS